MHVSFLLSLCYAKLNISNYLIFAFKSQCPIQSFIVGFHVQEFLRSTRARRRYWARSYTGWRRFTAAKPNDAHTALASLEKAGRINFMITQNVDRLVVSLYRLSFVWIISMCTTSPVELNFSVSRFRLHHRAGSNPLELHGTVYSVVCLDCGFSLCRNLFQDQVKALNPKVALEMCILQREF